MQSAYRAAELQASFPAINVLEPVCGSLLGVVLFSEHLRTGGGRPYIEAVAAVTMTWGVIRLARSPVVAAALSGRRAPVYTAG